MVQEAERILERQLHREWQESEDSVYRAIRAVRFVSKSKGIRNGKRRIRKQWKEVYLLRYLNDNCHGYRQWHRFPFDEYATEILGNQGGEYPHEALMNRVQELYGR